MISQQQKEIVLNHLKALKPIKAAIFGSYARDENKGDSDLDILVYLDYSNRISLLDLVSVEQDLSEALGIKVDLVTEKSMSPYILPYIKNELFYILE